MKKIFLSFICLIMLFAIISCDQNNTYPNGNDDPPSDLQDTPAWSETDDPSCTFISQEVKDTWQAELIAILSNVDVRDRENSIPGSHAVGLMDLNFDNVPEVFVAYPGGSMGNVFIKIYDLKTHNELIWYDGAHYANDLEILLYVTKSTEGYAVIAEGSIRLDIGWSNIIEKLPNHINTEDYYLKRQNLFTKAQSITAEDQVSYYFKGEPVDKSKYEEEYQKFVNDYQVIESTKIQLIKWSVFDLANKDQLALNMANALIGSSQQFIDYKAMGVEPTDDFTGPVWRDAYLEILEARKDISPSSYALVYVDADEIPELYVSGCCEAEGDIIYSFKNGNLFMQYLNRRFAGRYIEKGGLIINQNGHMGRYYTTIYTLCEDGFVLNFSGVRTESYEHIGNDNYITHTQYSIGEEVVSEDEFNSAVNSLFDFSRSIEFYDQAVSYNEIMQQLGVTVSDGK